MKHFSHTIYDPVTGEEIDVYVEDSSEAVRNGPGGRTSMAGLARPRSPGFGRPAPRGPVTRPDTGHRPVTVHPTESGEFVSVRKSDVVGLIPLGGELWAASLGRPDMPQATGDDVTDRTNAAMHRDALALHDQNRDRIRALAGLVERAAMLLLK